MKHLFELILREPRKMNSFIKTCEAMISHSDTALFKVKKRGVYILLTDFEGFCCLELRFTENLKGLLKLDCEEYSVKILLDSLTNILKKVAKNKHCAVVYSEDTQPDVLLVKECTAPTSAAIELHTVESTEHRPRAYYLMSTKHFQQKAQGAFLQFRILNAEFNKLITMQTILSGNNGGIGKISVELVPDEDGRPKDRCQIKFSTRNGAGADGHVKIHTRANDPNISVPVQHLPARSFEMTYLITYLKRSQIFCSVPTDYVTLYVSPQGLLIQTDQKEHHSIVVFITDVSRVDLSSFA